MSRAQSVLKNSARRQYRVRAQIRGKSERPRLTVFISGHHVSAQIIDDSKSKTLTAVSTVGKKDLPANLQEKATWVGTEISKQANTAKIKKVVFDRGSRLYHGRVKALAEAARAGGLEF